MMAGVGCGQEGLFLSQELVNLKELSIKGMHLEVSFKRGDADEMRSPRIFVLTLSSKIFFCLTTVRCG